MCECSQGAGKNAQGLFGLRGRWRPLLGLYIGFHRIIYARGCDRKSGSFASALKRVLRIGRTWRTKI